MAVTTAAIVSLSGMLHSMPSMPQNRGSTMSGGSRNISWRDSERNMLTFALPMLWKKLVPKNYVPT